MFKKKFLRGIVAAIIAGSVAFTPINSIAFADAQSDVAKYTAQIQANPNYAKAYNNRGNAYLDLKNYNQAIADYNKAIELNPNYAKAYYNRGIVYDDLKNYNQAIEDYNKAIQLNPNYKEAYIGRWLVYQALGDNARAQAEFQRAKEFGLQRMILFSPR